MPPLKVVHYLNQFFAGIGGEQSAGYPLEFREEPLGPGRLLQQKLGESGEVHTTIVCGDNYFHDESENVIPAIRDRLESIRPDLVVAGPAFNAGRYGLACGEVCAQATQLDLHAVTGVFRSAPASEVYRDRVVIVETGDTAGQMAAALESMVRVGLKLAQNQRLAPAAIEGTLPSGVRRNWIVEPIPAVRAVQMLLDRLAGSPFESEIHLPEASESVAPARALEGLRHASVALVTEGGLVPLQNPDGIETSSATRWARYPLSELADRAGSFHSIHAGYDAQWVNEDPNRIVPLDAARSLEQAGLIGELHPYFYVTVGTGTSVTNAARIGGEIAAKLIDEGVHAAIVTST